MLLTYDWGKMIYEEINRMSLSNMKHISIQPFHLASLSKSWNQLTFVLSQTLIMIKQI